MGATIARSAGTWGAAAKIAGPSFEEGNSWSGKASLLPRAITATAAPPPTPRARPPARGSITWICWPMAWSTRVSPSLPVRAARCRAPRNTPAPSRAATVAPPAPARSRSCRVPAWVVPSWPASPPPVPATRGGPLSAARWPWRRATTATSALHQPDQLRQRRGQPDPVPGSASGAGRGAGQCALGTAAGGVGRGLAGASPLLARLKHAPPVGFSCRPLATAARRARRARHWRGTP